MRDWDRYVETSAATNRDASRLARATTLVRAGHYTTAIAEAEHLTTAETATSDVLYNGAAVFSLASSVLKNGDPTTSEKFAMHALALLKRAAAKGFTDANYLRKDRDFEPLRSRDGFQKLITELTNQSRVTNLRRLATTISTGMIG